MMKKTISMVLALGLCISGVFAVEGTSPLALSEQRATDAFRLGKEAISQIRKDYQEGKYDSFLKESDSSYEQVRESEELIGLAQLRQGSELDLQWIDAVQKVQEERNHSLLQVIGENDSVFAQKVRAVATIDAQDPIFLKIHQMVPGSGKNQDENTLIALDLEYEYKSIHLDMPQIGVEESTDIRAKQYVLKMEQMDKMLLAAQSFQDDGLKQAVYQFAQNLDTRLAKSWDQRDLRDLVIGKIKPTDKLQEQTISVLKDTQEKLSDVSRDFMAPGSVR
jgi:hypothetical protein